MSNKRSFDDDFSSSSPLDPIAKRPRYHYQQHQQHPRSTKRKREEEEEEEEDESPFVKRFCDRVFTSLSLMMPITTTTPPDRHRAPKRARPEDDECGDEPTTIKRCRHLDPDNNNTISTASAFNDLWERLSVYVRYVCTNQAIGEIVRRRQENQYDIICVH